MTTTTVTHRAGASFAIQIRSHEIVVDQTLAGGGADSAPTPLELLGASLGGCIAYYVHQFLETRHLPAHGMKVSVSQTREAGSPGIDSFTVTVALPDEIPERYASMLERVLEVCPAYNTLVHGARINVAFDKPAKVAAV
jgi:uncharacterized OsmC-like protein